METQHQVDEQQRVGAENLNKIVAHDHWQKEYQTKLVERQHEQKLLVDVGLEWYIEDLAA